MKACVENGASCIDISGEPQVCELGKMLLCVRDLVKHLFVVFHVSVSEYAGKFCLPICSSKAH